MNISKHATKRGQQRGISQDIITLVLEIGTPRYKPKGAIEYSIPTKKKNVLIRHLKDMIKQLEKADSKGVLLKGNTIITVYHKKCN